MNSSRRGFLGLLLASPFARCQILWSRPESTGLQVLYATSPEGIHRATFGFWRTQQTAGAKTTAAFDNLRAMMRAAMM